MLNNFYIARKKYIDSLDDEKLAVFIYDLLIKIPRTEGKYNCRDLLDRILKQIFMVCDKKPPFLMNFILKIQNSKSIECDKLHKFLLSEKKRVHFSLELDI